MTDDEAAVQLGALRETLMSAIIVFADVAQRMEDASRLTTWSSEAAARFRVGARAASEAAFDAEHASKRALGNVGLMDALRDFVPGF